MSTGRSNSYFYIVLDAQGSSDMMMSKVNWEHCGRSAYRCLENIMIFIFTFSFKLDVEN